MSRYLFVLTVLFALTACATRGVIQYGVPASDGIVHDIWVANFRPTAPPNVGQRSPPRPEQLKFQMDKVSVPQKHQTGIIEWPKGKPDARTDFVTLSTASYHDITEFAAQVARADIADTQNTVLFVHGYNYTHGEAVYQLAQVRHDFEIPSPAVLFSWPSAGKGAGYLYDRDSVLIARDQLEAVIIALTRARGRKVVIMGHSMGNFLIMETLRQIEISGSVDVKAKVAALFMVSPDIDGELFRTQAKRLSALPSPTLIVTAEQDRALRISAFLTGRTNRLGSQTDRAAVGDLPVTVIDASDLGTGGANHDIGLTSPAAISIFKTLREGTLPGKVTLPPLVSLSDLR